MCVLRLFSHINGSHLTNKLQKVAEFYGSMKARQIINMIYKWNIPMNKWKSFNTYKPYQSISITDSFYYKKSLLLRCFLDDVFPPILSSDSVPLHLLITYKLDIIIQCKYMQDTTGLTGQPRKTKPFTNQHNIVYKEAMQNKTIHITAYHCL